jgi:hypothetical protein
MHGLFHARRLFPIIVGKNGTVGKVLRRTKRSKLAFMNKQNNSPKIHIDLVIVRVTMSGDIRMAKPCSTCLRIIQEDPLIRYIYYTDNDGNLIRELAKTMTTNHVCRSIKALKHKMNNK